PQCPASQVQRRGGAIYRHRVCRPDVVSDRLLEARHHRALSQKVRLQHLNDGVDVRLGDVLTAVRDHYTPAIRLNSMICSIFKNCGLEPELYSKPCSTSRPCSPSLLTLKSLLRVVKVIVGRST